MALDFLKSKKQNDDQVLDDDFVELDADMAEEEEKISVRAETLSEFKDVENVQEQLRNDKIIWVNIGPLKDRDMTDLKRAVKRLKKTVKAVDGDMAGVDEDWIIVCPEYAKIERTSENVED